MSTASKKSMKKSVPPPKKCEHNVQYQTCRKCPGPSICEHKRVRNRCVDCGGKSVCPHKKLKYSCSLCKTGSAICSHGVSKPSCKTCSPQNYCVHDRYKSRCKECGGGSFCVHNKMRSRCTDCSGGSMCPHDKRRDVCRECGGSAFCQHGRQKHTCRDCQGKSLCPHLRYPVECPDCFGKRCCKMHELSLCGHRGNPKYDGYCTHCFPQAFPSDPRVAQIRAKTKEMMWVHAILESAELPGDLEWVWDRPIHVDFFGGCCATKRRIDLRALVEGTMLAIEIDENAHKQYARSDEEARYHDLFMDFSGKYWFLRVNPDAFVREDDGQRVDPPFEERFPVAVSKIMSIVAEIRRGGDGVQDLVTIDHLFYGNL